MRFFPNSQVRVESNSKIDAEQKRNTSIDHSMQSKRSVRSLASTAILAGVSVAALGVAIQSDSSVLTYTSLASAITFGAAGLSGLLANVIVTFSNITEDESNKRENLIFILEVIGLNKKESKLVLDSLQTENVSQLVLVENDIFKATVLKIGVNAECLSRLDKGFASFKHYHSSKDIAVKSVNCESVTFENVFDASTY